MKIAFYPGPSDTLSVSLLEVVQVTLRPHADRPLGSRTLEIWTNMPTLAALAGPGAAPRVAAAGGWHAETAVLGPSGDYKVATIPLATGEATHSNAPCCGLMSSWSTFFVLRWCANMLWYKCYTVVRFYYRRSGACLAALFVC